MTASSHPKKNIKNARALFLVFCGSYILGDIIGCLRESVYLGIIVSSLILGYLFIQEYRRTFLSLLLGISMGFSFWQSAIMHQEKMYRELSWITQNFTLRGNIQATVQGLMFQKERSKVFLVNIDNFDKIDNFDNINKVSISKGKSSTTLFVEVPVNLTLRKGDIIGFSGKIENNITFPIHDFSRYAYFHGWFGTIYIPSFTHISRANPWIIEVLKMNWNDIFESYFPRDIAGTLLGMTIGSIDLLSHETKDAFIATGISHILVVSGSNIAFLIILLTFFLKYLPLWKYFRSSIIIWFLLFYGTIVGWDVSIIRATIMWLLSYTIVEYWGRWSSRASLAFTGLILTFYSPLAPLYDAWFWLSFSATFGILIFHQSIEKWCKKYRFPHTITSLLSVSIGAMIGSLPLVIYHFERIPLSSLLVNILIWGILGWILFSSVFFMWIQVFSHTLAVIVWYIVYIPTKFILTLSLFFRSGWIITIPSWIAPSMSVFILWIFLYIFWEESLVKEDITH